MCKENYFINERATFWAINMVHARVQNSLLSCDECFSAPFDHPRIAASLTSLHLPCRRVFRTANTSGSPLNASHRTRTYVCTPAYSSSADHARRAEDRIYGRLYTVFGRHVCTYLSTNGGGTEANREFHAYLPKWSCPNRWRASPAGKHCHFQWLLHRSGPRGARLIGRYVLRARLLNERERERGRESARAFMRSATASPWGCVYP